MTELDPDMLAALLRRAAKDISDRLGEGGPLTGDQVEQVARLFVTHLADYNCEMGRISDILA